MEDIFHWCREGNALQVRVWLDDTEHDMNQGDDHGFSPLHWAAKNGRANIVEMLIMRGSRINATNMGDDTALHLASAHGHRDIVHMLLRNKADINAINEHGNTPLHYACFWGYQAIAEDLINNGAMVSICNKYEEIPLDKCKGQMSQKLLELAVQVGQDTERIPYKDQSWLGTKTRSRDATLSRHAGINLKELGFQAKLALTPSGEIDDDLVARINMADAKFSFQEKGKMYNPAWMSPEALQKKQDESNVKAADMWSFSILLWELATREVPFADQSPMEIGMKIALEGLRITILPGISQHMSRLIRICMNEDPGKRPTFDMVLPILDKMKQ